MSDSIPESELKNKILRLPYWRHRIPLSNGEYTPGNRQYGHWEVMNMPQTLDGKSFLDIGSFDGVHAFEAERRGADHVLATDVWDHPQYDSEWWQELRPGKQGFELAHTALDSEVDSQTIPVEKLSPDAVGYFDVVLFAGVLYHLKEPYSALEQVFSVAEQHVVIESLVLDTYDSASVARFDKASETGGDWWVPTLSCIEDMAELAGAKSTESFKYSRSDLSSNRIPPVRQGRTVTNTDVFLDPEFSEKLATVQSETTVQVLYESEDAIRIEFRGDIRPFDGEETGEWKRKERLQGWVSKEKVSLDVKNDSTNHYLSLGERAVEIASSEGITSVLSRTYDYIRDEKSLESASTTRGVVHCEI